MSTALRCTTSAAAGYGLGTTIKYLERTSSGAAGNGRAQRLSFCAAPRASAWAPRSSKYLGGVAGFGLGTTIKDL
jgi:hypothetical protein